MLPKIISTGDLKVLLGITPNALGDLEKRGVIKRVAVGKWDFRETVQAYCSHLREIAAGRASENGDVDLVTERALLAKEQRRGHELKNAALEGRLVPADAVERRWATVFANIRARMLALPSDFAQVLPHLTRHDVDTIDRAVRDALTEAAEGYAPPGAGDAAADDDPEED